MRVGTEPARAVLQRSRHPKTAESRRRARRGGVWARRFNGAAIRRRRRVVARAQATTRHQGFNGAAIRRRRRGFGEAGDVATRLGASTEPPSEDGGERSTVADGACPVCMLQRSRHPKTAERTGYRQQFVDLLNASTEPPSEDGGETRPSGTTWPTA